MWRGSHPFASYRSLFRASSLKGGTFTHVSVIKAFSLPAFWTEGVLPMLKQNNGWRYFEGERAVRGCQHHVKMPEGVLEKLITFSATSVEIADVPIGLTKKLPFN